MKYSLIKKYLGVNKYDILLDFEVDFEINDIYYRSGFGFLLVSTKDHFIAKIDNTTKEITSWAGRQGVGFEGNDIGQDSFNFLKHPSSICYDSMTDSYIVVEDNGRRIKKIEGFSQYISSIFGTVCCKFMDKYFQKHNWSNYNVITDVSVNKRREIFWVNNIINKCFRFGHSYVQDLIGDGRSGYVIANHLQQSRCSGISSVCCNGWDTYISDTNNYCIRKISGDNISLITGSPMVQGDKDGKKEDVLLTNPTKLRTSKTLGYFRDDNKIKYLVLTDGSVNTVYESENIVSIDVDDNDVIVLVRS